MPITPRFDLTQTDTHVNLCIHVPHVRVSVETTQVMIEPEDSVLHVSAPPYLLLLHFAPHKFHPLAEEACATYEPTVRNGTLKLTLPKDAPGHWEHLDLYGKLTRARQQSTAARGGGITTSSWLQEVTSATDDHIDHGDSDHNDNAHDGPDQKPMERLQVDSVDDGTDNRGPDNTNHHHHAAAYGFLRLFDDIYQDLTRDGLAREMLELLWEDTWEDDATTTTMVQNRRQQRYAMEQEKFSRERWEQDTDLSEDYIYQCAMEMQPHWQQQGEPSPSVLVDQMSALSLDGSSTDSDVNFFSADEKLQLHTIPYPLLPTHIPQDTTHGLLLGLWDILFAYVYDHLTTDGDSTVESAWTISILSASLSCLEDYRGCTTREAVHSSLRRALIYPYLRNTDFAKHCAGQVRQILRQGIRCTIRCLLHVRSILDQSELYYLGNKVYIDPYLRWLQRDAESITPQLLILADDVHVLVAQDLGLNELKLAESESSSENTDDDGSNDCHAAIKSSTATENENLIPDNSNTGKQKASSALLDENFGSKMLNLSLS